MQLLWLLMTLLNTAANDTVGCGGCCYCVFADVKTSVDPSTYACTPNVMMHGFSADMAADQAYGTGWYEVNTWKASGKSHLFLTGMG